MTGFRKFRRSLRCHLKHGTRCPHIERHALHRPRKKKQKQAESQERPEVLATGRHAAPGR